MSSCFFLIGHFRGEKTPLLNHHFGGDQPAGWMTGPSPWWPPQVPNVAHDASRHNAAVAFNDKGETPQPVSKENPGVSPWWEKGCSRTPETKIFLAPENGWLEYERFVFAMDDV